MSAPSPIKPPRDVIRGLGEQTVKISVLERIYIRCCMLLPITAVATPVLSMFVLAWYSPVVGLLSTMPAIFYYSYRTAAWVAYYGRNSMNMLRADHDTDWRKEYEATSQKEKAACGNLKWDDAHHFVLLPNYDESLDVLRESLDSVAANSIAKTHISICLAMEERAKGSRERAETLEREYKGKFKYVMATYHPPKLPGEMPGKASNTKWAAERVWEYLESVKIPDTRVIFTVSDSDSEFHEGYFDCVNYRFLTTPEALRHGRIWQSPMFHYKNYHHQPALVRLSTMTGCLFYLAGLSEEPNRVWTYSTYSLTSHLAKSVGGWDPDWISEDMHMHLKCQLAIRDKLILVPIWLPTINYAPQGEDYIATLDARFSQGKRHALGFGEVAYYASNVPSHSGYHLATALRMLGTPGYGSVFWDTLTIHSILSINAPALIINLYLMATQDLGWLYYVDVLLLIVFHLFFLPLVYTGVAVYEHIQSRIHPGEGSWPWIPLIRENTWLHILYVTCESLMVSPVLYGAAATTEWIAASKIAITHKFDYAVAAKPDSLASPRHVKKA